MSEDSNILTVDENGLVTGVKQGSCKITAYSTEYSNLKSSVYIQSGFSHDLNVHCEFRTYMLKPGETLQLYTTKHNEEQGVAELYNDVTYSVRVLDGEEQVATVDENGLLTAITEGYAFVEVVDNNDFKMTDCRIEIKNKIPVDSLMIINTRLSDYYLDLDITTDKGKITLTTVSIPGNRLYENVTYSVDDESIATIDAETGLLTAIRNGDVTVTATSKIDASLEAKAYINISNQKYIDIISTYHEIKRLGGSIQLEVVDENGDDYTDGVTYTSRDNSIATVDETGVVTGVAAGKCIIEAVSKTDSRLSGTFEVTVFNGILKIDTIGNNNTIEIGQTVPIKVSLVLSDDEIVEYRNVEYSVNNMFNASVDSYGGLNDPCEGKITGLGEGKVTVTVVDRDDPGLSATATVTIIKKNN